MKLTLQNTVWYQMINNWSSNKQIARENTIRSKEKLKEHIISMDKEPDLKLVSLVAVVAWPWLAASTTYAGGGWCCCIAIAVVLLCTGFCLFYVNERRKGIKLGINEIRGHVTNINSWNIKCSTKSGTEYLNSSR